MADDSQPVESATTESTVTPGSKNPSETVVLQTDPLLRLIDDAVNDLQAGGHFNGRNVLEAAVEEARQAVTTAAPDTGRFVHELESTTELSTAAVATLQANAESNLSANAFPDESNAARMESAIGAAKTATTSRTQG